MPLKTIGTGRGLMGGGTYADKVLATGPIAYWPLWEKNGTVAHCLVNSAQNGTYSSAVNTWPVGVGIGDGNTAPFFDGTNDYVNVLTAALIAAVDMEVGSLAVWVKVANAGVWADGARRSAMTLWLNGANFSVAEKHSNAASMRYLYFAGGAAPLILQGGHAETDWNLVVQTWSDLNNANELKAYWAAVQENGTQAVGGNFAAGNIIGALIGAINVTPANLWHGWLAHAMAFDRVLTQPEITALATVA